MISLQPAKYLEIYNISGQRVAFLSPQSDGIKNARLSREKNGQVTLKFVLPRTSEKWTYINGLHKVKVNGRVFWISGTEEERDQQGRLLSNVQCEEIWVRDLGKQRINYLTVEILSSTAEVTLSNLLTSSGWTVGSVTVTGVHDLESEKQSLLWNVQKVQEIWGGVLVFNSLNKTVSLLVESGFGQDNGVQVRFGKNQKTIKKTVDHEIVTRLVPLGKDGLNISTVNGGLLYIENFQYTTEILEDTWEDQQYDDPAELKAKAIEKLAELSRPRATYTLNLVDLSSLSGYAAESFDLGDWLTVFDPEICPAGARAQIIKYDYDVFRPEDAEAELGDAQESLADILSSHSRAADMVNNIVAPNPGVGNLLKGVLNTLFTQINGASGDAVTVDGVTTYTGRDSQGNDNGLRLRISPAGIGISTDHGQNYATAITGAGIAGNTVICNELYALASGDGYTKLDNWGMRVYDGLNTKNLLTVNQATVEIDKTGFTAISSAALTRVTTEYQQGTAALRCVTPNATAGEGFKIDYINAYAGKAYSASQYLKGGTGGEAVYLRLRALDKDGNSLGTSPNTSCTLTTSWLRFSINNYEAPANTARLELETVTQSQQAATFYYDSGQIELRAAVTNYTAPANLKVALGQLASGIFGMLLVGATIKSSWDATRLEITKDGFMQYYKGEKGIEINTGAGGGYMQFYDTDGYPVGIIGTNYQLSPGLPDGKNFLINGTGWYRDSSGNVQIDRNHIIIAPGIDQKTWIIRDLVFWSTSDGPVLRAPAGQYYRIRVNDSGTLYTQAITL